MIKNKKGGLISTIILIVVVLAVILGVYIIYRNFHMTCVWDNIKSFANLNMTNCKR
jgi:flagellar basal body-associated protein FliL